MTETEFNNIVWLYQDAYQQLYVKYLNAIENGSFQPSVKRDLYIINAYLRCLNRYQASEIENDNQTLNYLSVEQVTDMIRLVNCFFNKYNIKYRTTDEVLQVELTTIPDGALVTEGGVVITTEAGVPITKEK